MDRSWIVTPLGVLGIVSCLATSGGALESTAAQDCGGTTFIVSGVVVAGLAVFDIATASASARHYNEQHMSIAPTASLRDHAYGVSVSWTFGRSPHPAPARRAIRRWGVAVDTVPGRKSPTTAALLSLGATAIPMATGLAASNGAGAAMFLGGLIVGPSVGHLYAGQVGRGLGTIALRAAGTAVGISSIVSCID